VNCSMRGSHSGLCLVCLFRGCLCYDTNVIKILAYWDGEIKKEESESE
jgi:hypothetical protein